MTEETFATQLWKLILRFRQTVWFRVTYLVLLGVIVAFLLPFTSTGLSCIVIFTMPILVFIVPYYLRERSLKHFALNALPVIVIAIIIGGAILTGPIYTPTSRQSVPGPFASPSMTLANGTVMPYVADSPTNFTFRVRLTTTFNATPNKFLVFLNLTTVKGFNDYPATGYAMVNVTGPGSSNNTRLGTWYEAHVGLSNEMYAYGFSVRDSGTNWTYTIVDFGPVTAPATSYYAFFAVATAVTLVLPFAFYYIILFMWWYTIRARATRARMLGAEPEIPKENPKTKADAVAATRSEKASKAAAFTCTNCGADVGEDDAKCPNCGAVFEE